MQELADYLLLLDSNDTLYNSYLWYKQHSTSYEDLLTPEYKQTRKYPLSLCELCGRVLQDRESMSLLLSTPSLSHSAPSKIITQEERERVDIKYTSELIRRAKTFLLLLLSLIPQLYLLSFALLASPSSFPPLLPPLSVKI